MSLLTLFIYAVGTNQGFTDSIQLSLLRLYIALGLFLSVTSVYGIIISAGRFIKLKKVRYIFRTGTYVFLVVFGVSTVLAVMFIITLSAGNGA